MDSIRDQVATVARLRAGTAEATAQLDAERAAWNAEHRGLIDQEALYRRDLETAEAGLRHVAEAAYQATGTTTPAPGVVVKLYTRCDYEPGKALAWAQQHSLCLVLDVRGVRADRPRRGGRVRDAAPGATGDARAGPRRRARARGGVQHLLQRKDPCSINDRQDARRSNDHGTYHR